MVAFLIGRLVRLEDRAGDGRITPLPSLWSPPVVAPSNTKVSPIPLSNCFVPMPLVLSLQRNRFSRVGATRCFWKRNFAMNLETTHHAARQRPGPEEQMKELGQSRWKSAANGV